MSGGEIFSTLVQSGLRLGLWIGVGLGVRVRVRAWEYLGPEQAWKKNRERGTCWARTNEASDRTGDARDRTNRTPYRLQRELYGGYKKRYKKNYTVHF